MLVHEIPYHLRNTVEHLDLPIYFQFETADCRPPAELALGDSLMLLGAIRNYSRPVRLFFRPGAAKELIQGHPLISELAEPAPGGNSLGLTQVPLARSGRGVSWYSNTVHRLSLPVLPVDQVRVNPVLAHSLYYNMPGRDDRPEVFLDPAHPPALSGILSKNKPTLIVYPLNPGRQDHFWQDPAWWLTLLTELGKSYALVAIGGRDYGELSSAVDQTLSMDDPASTLADIAWLIANSAGFVGRDGGLNHIAAATNPKVVTIWDSMGAYRFWAGGYGNHLLMSNPYTFRYPQTQRLDLEELKQQVRAVQLPDGQGGLREVALPEAGYESKVSELFGSVEAFANLVLGQREINDDRMGVQAWLSQPEVKERSYGDSQAFVIQALQQGMPPGATWVAPVFP